MSDKELREYLDSFINYEKVSSEKFPREFHLIRLQKLLSLIGNPEKSLKAIHIAGSKGKGSTATILTNVLKCAGYKIGLYTSPHIYDLTERISIFDKESSSSIFDAAIPIKSLAECVDEIKESIEEVRHDKSVGRLSFFEVFTAIAFYYFAKEKVDFAVIETGLGGRLDATNVIDSMIAVITAIGYEHTHILGDDIKDIAREKAAIIKKESQGVVVARQLDGAKEVVLEQCEKMKCDPVLVEDTFHFMITNESIEAQTFVVKTEDNCLSLCTKLLGEHQVKNVCTVLGVVKLLREYGYTITDEDLTDAVRNTQWPIRFEVLSVSPTVILDAAHTNESMQCLVETLRDILPDKRFRFILGFSDDKDIGMICQNLKNIDCDVIFTKANHPRAHVFVDEEVRFTENFAITNSVDEAAKLAFEQLNSEVIVVTGSVFVASEARKILIKENKHVPV